MEKQICEYLMESSIKPGIISFAKMENNANILTISLWCVNMLFILTLHSLLWLLLNELSVSNSLHVNV